MMHDKAALQSVCRSLTCPPCINAMKFVASFEDCADTSCKIINIHPLIDRGTVQMNRTSSNFPSKMLGPEKTVLRSSAAAALLCAGILLATPSVSLADESGTSFWLPGIFGSLAAVPETPGWAVASVYYHTSVSAGADVAAAREIQIGRFNPTLNVNLNANLHASADLAILVPSYVFATPVLGGQLAVQMGTIVGSTSANVNGTLSASLPPFSLVRTDSIGDTMTGVGDLYPQASLKWNFGVNNFMTYITGDVPVGNYSSTSLANLGLGHGAIDAGSGYTYFNPATGHEFSAVAGFTYNFMNPTTQYQMALIFTWIGGRRSSCRSSSSSASLVMPTIRSALIAAPATKSVRLSHGSSRSAPNWGTFFRFLESKASLA
jgi:hypothetical protein